MHLSLHMTNPIKHRTEHQARKEELEKITRQILELELMKKLVIEVSPRPKAADMPTLILRADVQEMVVNAATELWRLLAHYTKNGHTFSYRNFLVAAAAVGIICENARCKWFIKLAYNTKPHKNQEKKCAEMRIEKAMAERSAKIALMAIVAFPQPGDNTLALHPCPECRNLMRDKYRKLYSQYSRLVLVHPTAPDREGYTIGGLMSHHHEPDLWTH